jgi:hypothetical protein
MDLKVLNDGRALTIANSLVTVVSALTARNSVITAVFTDNASNDASILHELQSFSLQCQARLPTIRILCVIHTANFALGDFLTESRRAMLCDIWRIVAAHRYCTGARFSDLPRLREERWFSLGDITNYTMIHWMQLIGFLKGSQCVGRHETSQYCQAE